MAYTRRSIATPLSRSGNSPNLLNNHRSLTSYRNKFFLILVVTSFYTAFLYSRGQWERVCCVALLFLAFCSVRFGSIEIVLRAPFSDSYNAFVFLKSFRRVVGLFTEHQHHKGDTNSRAADGNRCRRSLGISLPFPNPYYYARPFALRNIRPALRHHFFSLTTHSL